MTAPAECYIGLMSGTSLDGVDAALVTFTETRTLQLLASSTTPLPDELRHQLLTLTQPGNNEIDQLGAADVAFARFQADAVLQLLTNNGISSSDIIAIGSHGQTLRHRPEQPCPFTLQIGDPHTLAELTGIDVVSDFRRRDMAAGGQGAPLVPAFHADCFRSHHVNRVILNIGGIANITLLPADSKQPVLGFDTGPGNLLMDDWILSHHGARFDRDGAWAAEHQWDDELLAVMLQEPYFAQPAPKSTGRELFNRSWLETQLHTTSRSPSQGQVQATLLELTARSISNELTHLQLGRFELYVCGGGAHNSALLQRLDQLLPEAKLASTAQLGLAPDWVEATAFAWLAMRFVQRQPGNLAAVTGACGPRILGTLAPA